MLRRLGWLIGLNGSKAEPAKKLPDARPHSSAKVSPVVVLDAAQEIAVYIHRFHNLDLFQQGWYQLKITVRWESCEDSAMGSPARVLQYEAPNLGSDEVCAAWMIDDVENSFLTNPFRIKYARQDVLLGIMVVFNLPFGKDQDLSSSACILKFELLYAPTLVNGSDFQPSPDACPAAVHQFRIPPKALMGLHSYCPVQFDAFHAVLVDVTIHLSLLKAGTHTALPKAPEQMASDAKQVMLVTALLDARDTLIKDLQNLSSGINEPLDLTEMISKMNDTQFSASTSPANLGSAHGAGPGPGRPRNGLEEGNSLVNFGRNGCTVNLSNDDIVKTFHILGDQVSYLWNIFLKYHRDNNTKILEFLCDAWSRNRRAEWSIWMVYSTVEMPIHYIKSGVDNSSFPSVHKRDLPKLKLTDDPAQISAMHAELHRQSIAQMRINNRSIQDLHVFGDPLRIPVIIVEQVVNGPRRSVSGDSYLRNLELKHSVTLLMGPNSKAAIKPPSSSPAKSDHDLKIVIFVHGFQGHHLDLRLVRNQWLLIDPKIEFLMSEVNEDKTSGDLREMGERLAQEVVSFLKRRMDKASRSRHLSGIKLSFVGHSIGNIIIRAALADSILEPYLRFLHTYVSVSGPHLGYLYSSNSLFNSGLWILKKFKGTPCIHQLTFTDDPDLRNTFLYKLCQKKTLRHFKHIILLASPQDGYVPHHSARIESCKAASLDNSKKGKVFLEMLNSCLDQIRSPSSPERVFMRCDVNFDTSSYGKNLNTIIGRTAHIEFLESDIFARLIMWSFPDLFRYRTLIPYLWPLSLSIKVKWLGHDLGLRNFEYQRQPYSVTKRTADS